MGLQFRTVSPAIGGQNGTRPKQDFANVLACRTNTAFLLDATGLLKIPARAIG